MKKLICLDPGWGGAVVYYIPKIRKVGASLCPLTPRDMLKLVSSLQSKYGGVMDGWIAVMENNHSSPIFGAKGNFGLGRNIGSWETTFASFNIRIEYVNPKTWQKLIRQEKSSFTKGRQMVKEKSWKFAKRCYPQYNDMLGETRPSPRNPRQGISDALCLLEYIRRRGNGEEDNFRGSSRRSK